MPGHRGDHIGVGYHRHRQLDRSLVLVDTGRTRYRLPNAVRPVARAVFRTAPNADPDPGSAARLEAAGLAFAYHYTGVLQDANDAYARGDLDLAAGLARFDLEAPNFWAAWTWAAARWQNDRDVTPIAAWFPNVGMDFLQFRLAPRDAIAMYETALSAARMIEQRQLEGIYSLVAATRG